MLCETCRWTVRPGFVRAPQSRDGDDHRDMIPCPDCGGSTIAHCCDGICVQPEATTSNKTTRSAGTPYGEQRRRTDIAEEHDLARLCPPSPLSRGRSP